MPDLHPKQAVFFYKRLMPTQMRTSNPGTGGVAAILVDQLAFNDINFFAADMNMLVKLFTSRPTDQGNRFCAMLVQRKYFEVTLPWLPFGRIAVDTNMIVIIRLELVKLHQ